METLITHSPIGRDRGGKGWKWVQACWQAPYMLSPRGSGKPMRATAARQLQEAKQECQPGIAANASRHQLPQQERSRRPIAWQADVRVGAEGCVGDAVGRTDRHNRASWAVAMASEG